MTTPTPATPSEKHRPAERLAALIEQQDQDCEYRHVPTERLVALLEAFLADFEASAVAEAFRKSPQKSLSEANRRELLAQLDAVIIQRDQLRADLAASQAEVERLRKVIQMFVENTALHAGCGITFDAARKALADTAPDAGKGTT